MKRFHTWLAAVIFLALMTGFNGPLVAGGGPQNVLVVVNDNSSLSQQVGNYYVEKRGIPPRNLFHIQTSTNYTIDTASFSNEIRGPIFSYINNSGLSNQIDYIVLSMDIPYRVRRVIDPFPFGSIYTNDNGITAALFYGFKDYSNLYVNGCTLPLDTFQDYFESERSFQRTESPVSNRYYLSSMLTSYSLDQTRWSIDRTVKADHTAPTNVNTVFMHTFDPFRNVRWPQFEDAAFSMLFLDGPEPDVKKASYPIGFTNLMGVNNGRINMEDPRFPWSTSMFIEGCIADNLTSFGGCLYDSQGQSTVLDWIKYGVAGSYGTVVEPCNYTNKFPEARAHFWYARGFNLAESYWMSVQAPYMGNVVGDPLTQPYAAPPGLSVVGITNGQIVSGIVTVRVQVAESGSKRIKSLNYLIDGKHAAVWTNASLSTNTVVFAGINGTNVSYRVQQGDDLYSVASGVASSLNSSNLGVTARAFGDRVALVQDALGVPGSNNSCVVWVTNAVHSPLLDVWSPATNFMESPYRARRLLEVSGVPDTGDLIRIVITRLDNSKVTNEIVAAQNEGARSLVDRMITSINNDSDLQGTNGCEASRYDNYNASGNYDYATASLFARKSGGRGYNLEVDYDVIGSGLDDTSEQGKFTNNYDSISARSAIFLSAGWPAITVTGIVNTTSLADGPHELRFVADDGTAVRAQGFETVSIMVSNHSFNVNITDPLDEASFESGQVVTAQVSATVSGASITSVSFYVQGKLLANDLTDPYQFVWKTASNGPGRIALQAKAYDNSGASALSSVQYVTVYTDDDSDGLPGWWEYVYFGGDTNAVHTSDSDSDGMVNSDEYIAGTVPTNNLSFFASEISRASTGTPVTLEFQTSSRRYYQVRLNDVSLTTTSAWFNASSNDFRGTGGIYQWVDDGVSSPPMTNDQRYYRIEAVLP